MAVVGGQTVDGRFRNPEPLSRKCRLHRETFAQRSALASAATGPWSPRAVYRRFPVLLWALINAFRVSSQWERDQGSAPPPEAKPLSAMLVKELSHERYFRMFPLCFDHDVPSLTPLPAETFGPWVALRAPEIQVFDSRVVAARRQRIC